MLTAAALLELDFNQPSLDYHELMKLTKNSDKGLYRGCGKYVSSYVF